RPWSAFLHRLDARQIGLPLVVVGLAVVFSIRSDVVLTVSNWQNLGRQAAALACVAFGQAFVVLTGGLDLSVGSTVALASVVAALTMGSGPVLAILIAIAVGVGVGLVNGLVVTRLRVPPFVATLAMLSIAAGLALNLSGGTPIVGLPESFTALGYSRVLWVPVPVIIAAVVFLVAFFVLRFSRLGRNIYATGGNAESARLSGINIKATILSTYVICSSLAAIGGLILTARVASGQPSLGADLPLQYVAAVVLGGVALHGGRGGLVAVAVGVACATVLTNGLNVLNVSYDVQLMVVGVAMN